MSINPLYNGYTPTRISIANLGINIEPITNETLSLTSEYLVVGETITVVGSSTSGSMSMIVDSRGVAINTNLENRRTSRNNYNTEIHGTTLIQGDFYVEGEIFKNGSVWGSGAGSGSNGDIFKRSYNGRGIYYNGNTTLGSFDSSSNNQYTLNISKSLSRNIDTAHIAIQNNNRAVAKVAIIGEDQFSPLIFNTSSNVPVEFHIGRSSNFFVNAYKRTIDRNGNFTSVDADVPAYVGKSDSPHLNIDINGNVGIKTNFNRLLRFNIRGLDENNGIEDQDQVVHPDLFVNGTTFSSNILMFDYESGTHKNLDELYSRRYGQSIVTSNLVPGKFTKGFFGFQSNISIMGDIDQNSSLIVYGNTSNTENITLDGNLNTGKTLTTRTIHVHERATFSNNLYIQDNIFVKANIYKYVGSNVLTGEDKYDMLLVNDDNILNIQNGESNASDFFNFGSGYGTKGRFGVGINVNMGDQVNNQLVVSKKDRTIFELELRDNNNLGFIKAAFIGHPKTNYDSRTDGSLVFITPSPKNEEYHLSQTNARQNIYFYPGYEGAISDFTINSNNPPIFGMFVNHKIGIKTFNPTYDFDVTGDIAATGNYYFKRPNQVDIKMGIWNDRTFVNQDSEFGGMFYYNEASPHVGINTVPQSEYGLTISGKVLSIDGYYTIDGLKTIPLYNSSNASLKPESEYEYAYFRGRLGIGDLGSIATLSVRESDYGLNTSVKILNSASGQDSTLHFIGNANEYIQSMNDTDSTFELFNGASNEIYNRSLSRAFITKKYPNGFNQLILNSNIGYGVQKSDAALVVNGNVDIKGDLNITGTYKISSRAIDITAGEPVQYYKTPDTKENVYISGEDIHLNTRPSDRKGTVYIGWENTTDTSASGALLNITLDRLKTTLPFVSKFRTINTETALTEYRCSTNYTAVMGIYENKFYIGASNTREIPYIVVANVPNVPYNSTNTTMGIGTFTPNGSRLHIYTQINGQPLTTFTRYNNTTDNDGIFADISLEKSLTSTTYKWNIHGPVRSGNSQKLQFLYQDTTNTGYNTLTEKLCITKEGCIGINNPNPQYAIDINGDGVAGSIRMRQSNNTLSRQSLIFQSGSDNYGSDLNKDYSIYASNNTFTIESSDTSSTSPIFHVVSSNNSVGIKMKADPNYAVSINGKLNVSDEILIKGRSFFSVLDNNLDTGSYLEWKNIFINPDSFHYGGVCINGVKPTSNIFQINSGGSNGNVAVFNSIHPQSLIHFRNLRRSTLLEESERIWRTGSSNNSFILEHRSNVSYEELMITDTPDNYGRVNEYIQSDIIGEFIQRLNGSIELDAINPTVTMNAINTIGASNDNMYIITSNLGIGTALPDAKLHIENNDMVESFKITHNDTTCNIVAINYDNFVITNVGDIGIGTTTPEAKLHIVGSTKFQSDVFEVAGDSIFRNNITIKGNLVNDSDFRIKKDVKVIEDALTKIQKISGYTFIKNDKTPRETGVIAQEIREVLPEAVFDTADGLLGVAYGNIIGLLIEGIKELNAKVDGLAKHI